MDPKKFEQIVNEVVSLQGRPIESRQCPDQYLGSIGNLLNEPKFSMRVPAKNRPEEPCVLMVLESPHIDEFKDEPGPAKGLTGEMIRQHLGECINISGLEDYGLVLVNAIQHQCSLGSNTIVYRDRIFRAVWSSGGEEDFHKRIADLYLSGDVVVNCCTKGNDYEMHIPLRNLVEMALGPVIPNVARLRRMHPASWRKAEWRGVIWRV